MARRLKCHEAGAALITVMLVILILAAIGVFVVIAVDRNSEKQASFAKSIAGFYAAEAGLNRGAAEARNTFLNFDVPMNCSPNSTPVNTRNVTYQLSGCGQAPVVIQVPAGEPFEGLSAIRYIYDLQSSGQHGRLY